MHIVEMVIYSVSGGGRWWKSVLWSIVKTEVFYTLLKIEFEMIKYLLLEIE